MIERAETRGKSSSIVNIASGASSIRGIPNRYVYGATKAAVIGLTKAVAADFIRKGHPLQRDLPRAPCSRRRSNSASRRSARRSAERDKAMEMFVSRQPMGRLGTAEEMAAVAVYLASDESDFTTGITISPDGGFAL